jgi:hypothetical protein
MACPASKPPAQRAPVEKVGKRGSPGTEVRPLDQADKAGPKNGKPGTSLCPAFPLAPILQDKGQTDARYFQLTT